MEKIKVLHLIKTLNFGGAELNLFNLVQAIDSDRFEIYVGYSFGGELEKEFKKRGIKLFKFAKGNHKIKSFASLAILWRLAACILRNKIDIVHTHTFNAHIWGSLAAKITGRKIVEHVHDSRYLPPGEFERRREFSRQYRYIKYMKKISDRVIVLTRQNYEFLLRHKLYRREQVRKIPNGIPFLNETGFNKEKLKSGLKEKLGIKEDNLVILTAFRFSPEKNVDLVFNIAPAVKKECPGAVFIISGDGPLFEEFQAKSRKQNLDGTIKMLGFYSQIYELLSISDIFLLPSFLELHSIAILEALSMKVPVVVSKGVGSNDEFIKNWNNGVLLDPFTKDGWADNIIKLLRNAELRQVIGKKGYELCRERFNIKTTAGKIENVYVELIAK